MAYPRNAQCPCQSGKKFKKCCLFKDQGYVEVEENGKKSWQKAVQIQALPTPQPRSNYKSFDLGEVIR